MHLVGMEHIPHYHRLYEKVGFFKIRYKGIFKDILKEIEHAGFRVKYAGGAWLVSRKGRNSTKLLHIFHETTYFLNSMPEGIDDYPVRLMKIIEKYYTDRFPPLFKKSAGEGGIKMKLTKQVPENIGMNHVVGLVSEIQRRTTFEFKDRKKK